MKSAGDVCLTVPLRTQPRAEWVFLPEVSLGAALRGLAPPTLAGRATTSWQRMGMRLPSAAGSGAYAG